MDYKFISLHEGEVLVLPVRNAGKSLSEKVYELESIIVKIETAQKKLFEFQKKCLTSDGVVMHKFPSQHESEAKQIQISRDTKVISLRKIYGLESLIGKIETAQEKLFKLEKKCLTE